MVAVLELIDFNSKFNINLLLIIFICNCVVEAVVVKWALHKPTLCVEDMEYVFPKEQGPYNVSIQLIIGQVYGVSEEDMTFGLQVKLYEFWNDPSLNISNFKLKQSEQVPQNIIKCIWKPDTVFKNCKEVKLFDYPKPNTYLKVDRDGSFYRTGWFRLLATCYMDFHLYPLDSQNCSLNIVFLASRSNEANLYWKEKTKTFGETIVLESKKTLTYEVHAVYPERHTYEYKKGINYTTLTARFIFTRRLTGAILNTYIPSLMVVALSYISFWLDIRAVPGRVTVGVTALLTLATEIVHVRNSLPPLDYMTALDIWLFGCLFLVFMSLLEFTLAQIWSRKTVSIPAKASRNNSVSPQPAWSTTDEESKERDLNNKLNRKTLCIKELHIKKQVVEFSSYDVNVFDKVSRFLFPGVTILFTLSYWLYFAG